MIRQLWARLTKPDVVFRAQEDEIRELRDRVVELEQENQRLLQRFWNEWPWVS